VTLRIHPEARLEFQRSAAYYRTISRELAARFTDDVEQAFRDVLRSPFLYPILENPARAKLLDDFPFSIVYAIESDVVFVIAVMHQKRRPGYWRSRI
jgi:toxin ParE1/3/4